MIRALGVLIFTVWTAGCSSRCGEATEQNAGANPVPEAEAPPCQVTATSTLPGARMDFPTSRCRFTVAEAQRGIAIPYVLTLEQELSGVTPIPQDAGGCGTPGPSGLIVFEKLSGGGQSYCICDEGECGEAVAEGVLRAGRFVGDFIWDGTNWFGASDYEAEKGPAFPPGTYTLEVSAEANLRTEADRVRVAGTLDITLTP